MDGRDGGEYLDMRDESWGATLHPRPKEKSISQEKSRHDWFLRLSDEMGGCGMIDNAIGHVYSFRLLLG